MKAFARFVTRHPVAVLVAVALGTLLALQGLVDLRTGRPRVEVDPAIDRLLPEGDDERRFYDRARELFGSDQFVLLVLETDDAFGAPAPRAPARRHRGREARARGAPGASRSRAPATSRSATATSTSGPFFEEVPATPEARAALRERVVGPPALRADARLHRRARCGRAGLVRPHGRPRLHRATAQRPRRRGRRRSAGRGPRARDRDAPRQGEPEPDHPLRDGLHRALGARRLGDRSPPSHSAACAAWRSRCWRSRSPSSGRSARWAGPAPRSTWSATSSRRSSSRSASPPPCTWSPSTTSSSTTTPRATARRTAPPWPACSRRWGSRSSSTGSRRCSALPR